MRTTTPSRPRMTWPTRAAFFRATAVPDWLLRVFTHHLPSNGKTALLGGFCVHLRSQCAGLVLPNGSRPLVKDNDKEAAKQDDGQRL